MDPQATTVRSNGWRLWHGLNYFTGGGTFLIGSIILFPIFADYFDVA